MFNKGGKTPISYYGGKQRLASRIVKMIPKHTVYVEPFAGGGAVFFAKPWPNVTSTSCYREVINDKDERLINFYRVLQSNGEELARRLSLTPYSEAEHRRAKNLDINQDDLIDAAVRYFINISQSFAKQLGCGWGRSVIGTNDAATWINRTTRLQDWLNRMAGVYIACNDAIKIIKQWDSPQTFFYCDPPYPGTNCGHYDGYALDNFQELINTLAECQGSFMLSNYPQANVNIPHDWDRFEINTTNSAKGRVGYDRSKETDESDQNRKRVEVIWKRQAAVPPRKEIQKLYDSGAYDCFEG